MSGERQMTRSPRQPARDNASDRGVRTSVRTSVWTAVAMVGLVLMAGSRCAQSQPAFQPVICPGGFAAAVDPLIPLAPLKAVANPVLPKDPLTGLPTLRDDLKPFIKNQAAAIQLGKALFWDMQVGSDNRTACATCHFHAGADRRERNQVNPGANGVFNGFSPNTNFSSTNFPFTTPARDTDDIAGSQGVRSSQFQNVDIHNGAESTTPVADPVFNVGGANVRRVTGKNTPSVINAVFNHRNFWNGRAQSVFDGVNPFGGRDLDCRVWELGYTGGKPVPIDIKIELASLASQTVGPVLNTTEMSAAGRTFPDVGRKLLLVKPLQFQQVSPNDGVLGLLADTGTGLNVNYASLIQQAFLPKWWNSATPVDIGGKSYSMMEANFSLYWGLAIMFYEATLVSDDSPMDQYLGLVGTNRPPASDPRTAVLDPVVARLNAEGVPITRDNIVDGLHRFEAPLANPIDFGVAGFDCIACHNGGELTSASVANVTGLRPEDARFVNAGFDMRMERMFMQVPPVPKDTTIITFDPVTSTVFANVTNPVRVATYDAGWYNLGVRPTDEDLGLGDKDPYGNFLSFTQFYQQWIAAAYIRVPGNGLGCGFTNVFNAAGTPLLSGTLRRNEDTAEKGAFKTPGLRNVELNGPYFHNGGKSTLMQVVQFYHIGGDFPGNPDRSPAIVPLGITPDHKTNLVAFLISLTDERVRWQQAPFDHPQLFVPDGQNPDGSDNLVEIPVVGASGAGAPIQRFLNLNPFDR